MKHGLKVTCLQKKIKKWLIVQIEVNLKIDLFCHFNDYVIIIIIIIIIIVITFMHRIYSYMPETNHVSKVNSVAAAFTICAACNVISPVKCVLYFYINTYFP